MANTLQPRASARRPERGADKEQRTRRRLLEVAGEVFAEKGFDRATSKEICQRAEANVAAVNYHFGSIEGLYAAVVWEAHNRLLPFAAVSSAAASKTTAKAKLRAILELLGHVLTTPASSAWEPRVLAREIVAPSPVLDELREQEILPKSRLLRTIVGEMMGLAVDHPAVARSCISIMGPIITLLVLDRTMLKRIVPALGTSRKDAKALAEHFFDFAVAGLGAVSEKRRVK